MSQQVVGIDHVAITVADIEVASAFYERLFGAKTVFQYAPADKVLVRQIAIGNTVLSLTDPLISPWQMLRRTWQRLIQPR
jgi:catechol 2,3-dioxygenase-like lactoylglutathione lyase family enzyme